MSRKRNVLKNTVFSYINTIITMLIRFLSRTIFIYQLGTFFVGVNDLFISILGILSFAELGIGTVLNTALYKPVAENRIGLVKSYVKLYKKIYYCIALAIFVIGLCIFPFLGYIAKGLNNITLTDLKIYFLLYLLNSCISYLAIYQVSLIYAEQKNYIWTTIDLAFRILLEVLEIIGLIVYRSFLMYLIIQICVNVCQRIFQICYFRKHYHFIYDDNVKSETIEQGEMVELKKNTASQFINKVCEISINSTDSIIVSSFINVLSVGILGNFRTLITYINLFKGGLFNEAIPSIGNLRVNNSKEEYKIVFKRMLFVSIWGNGVIAALFLAFSNQFIEIWIGKNNQLDFLSVLFLSLTIFFNGISLVYYNFKTATGIFYDDIPYAVARSIINIVISLVGVIWIGIPGVLLGTLISELFQMIIRVRKSYDRVIGGNINEFYWYILIQTIKIAIITVIVFYISKQLIFVNKYLDFVIKGGVSFIVANVVFFLLNCYSPECKYYLHIIYNQICNIRKR